MNNQESKEQDKGTAANPKYKTDTVFIVADNNEEIPVKVKYSMYVYASIINIDIIKIITTRDRLSEAEREKVCVALMELND